MSSSSAPSPAPDPGPAEPANLRLLRRLVTVLMAVMIGGFILIVAIFAMRLSGDSLAVPEVIALPDGVKAEAFTMGRGWYAVVTDDDRILIFDAATGALRQSIAIR